MEHTKFCDKATKVELDDLRARLKKLDAEVAKIRTIVAQSTAVDEDGGGGPYSGPFLREMGTFAGESEKTISEINSVMADCDSAVAEACAFFGCADSSGGMKQHELAKVFADFLCCSDKQVMYRVGTELVGLSRT